MLISKAIRSSYTSVKLKYLGTGLISDNFEFLSSGLALILSLKDQLIENLYKILKEELITKLLRYYLNFKITQEKIGRMETPNTSTHT